MDLAHAIQDHADNPEPRFRRLSAAMRFGFPSRLRHWLRVLLKGGLLAGALLWLSMPLCQAKPRQVLVLYSLGPDAASAWQSSVHQGLAAQLASANLGAELAVYEERLDAVRIGDAQAQAAMEPYLRAKYAHTRFDAVVTENYMAARFLSERPDLFPGAQRHYLNHGRLGWRPADGVGYEVQTDFSRAIGVIAQVAPAVHRVVVIGDSTERIQQSVQAVRLAAAQQRQISFEYWDQLSYEEMYQRAEALRPGTAVFLLPVYRDREGARQRPADVARRLAASTRVPIFTNWEIMVVPGVTGGYVISGERLGRAIADLLMQKTPDIASVPGYLFDYPTVQRFRLQNLPAETQWLNRPQTVLEQYLWQIVAGVMLIVVQGILISALVVALRDRRQSLCALNDERNQLEARVLQRTTELRAANAKLEQLATTDPLTGIGNRRRMTEQIGRELERCRRFGRPLSLLMVDIDHFKNINDLQGHEAGDRALVAVARALAEGMRSIDLTSRFGGEEFVLLMPETEIGVAAQAAERLRREIAALRIDGDDGRPFGLTISIGVAWSDPAGAPDTASSLLSRADRALYRAKHEGRDRVVYC